MGGLGGKRKAGKSVDIEDGSHWVCFDLLMKKFEIKMECKKPPSVLAFFTPFHPPRVNQQSEH